MDEPIPSLDNPTPSPMSWLARNRKATILGAIGVVFVAAVAVGIILAMRKPATNTTVTNNANDAPDVIIVNTTSAPRPTFQRSTVVNTSTTLPPSYTPPDRNDLQEAIDKLTP